MIARIADHPVTRVDELLPWNVVLDDPLVADLNNYAAVNAVLTGRLHQKSGFEH